MNGPLSTKNKYNIAEEAIRHLSPPPDSSGIQNNIRDDNDFYDPKNGFTTPTAVEVSFTSPLQSLGTTSSSTSSKSIEYQPNLSKISAFHLPCINTNLECDDMLFKRTQRRLSTAPILPDIPSPSDQNDNNNYNGVSLSDPLSSPQSDIVIASSQHLQPPNHRNPSNNNTIQSSSIVYIDHDFNHLSTNTRRKLFLSVDLDDEAVATTLTSQNYSSSSPSVNLLRRRSMTYPFL